MFIHSVIHISRYGKKELMDWDKNYFEADRGIVGDKVIRYLLAPSRISFPVMVLSTAVYDHTSEPWGQKICQIETEDIALL